MKRRIIEIDQDKCNGCGACAAACHEGAIGMIGGKAKLLRDDHCDGLGDCLPACPAGAIAFEEREAPAYDHAAVLAAKRAASALSPVPVRPAGGDTLLHWPVQLKLTPVKAPAFRRAELLLAADCAAYAHAAFHDDFIRGRAPLIGCPKLDDADYAEKLGEIIRANDIRSITVARMEVPCCGGIENAVNRAVAASGKYIPVKVDIITTDGQVID